MSDVFRSALFDGDLIRSAFNRYRWLGLDCSLASRFKNFLHNLVLLHFPAYDKHCKNSLTKTNDHLLACLFCTESSNKRKSQVLLWTLCVRNLIVRLVISESQSFIRRGSMRLSIALAVLLCINFAQSYKILVYCPRFMQSINNFLGNIADILVEEGHDVVSA